MGLILPTPTTLLTFQLVNKKHKYEINMVAIGGHINYLLLSAKYYKWCAYYP